MNPAPRGAGPPVRGLLRRGQALTEFAILYAGVILPLTFMTFFVAQAMWIWHGMTEWTRDGARYAATHCYDLDATNRVIGYMQTNVPPIIDRAQFQAGGGATIQVQYATPACEDCIPDTVTISVTDYTFGRLSGYLRLPGIPMPSFATNLPMESAGFRDGTGTCAQP
jgi:hypothetical protein